MLYPTLTLGPHWFAYAAQQFRLTPYLYYDAYDPDHEWYVETLQAFIGYQIRREKTTVVFKAGRLSSAFGAFPLHYDDADNALLDQPLSYIQTLTLRNDQIPCGVADLLWQHYGYVCNRCGGASGGDRGLTPVTLYGLPGIQAEVSSHRVDGRIQVTSGSPSNPLSLSHAPQYAQWVPGGGYTIRQGFRVGISGFRGPYLSPNVAPLLPAGTSVRDFPASGLGLDVQWARGHWSASGEWQRFQYDLPGFTQAPSVISTYGEAKRILTPRLYPRRTRRVAQTGRRRGCGGASTNQFSPWIASYELGGGWWLNRHQLLKASYEWLRIESCSRNADQCAGSPVRDHVPRPGPGVSLNAGSGSRFPRQIHFASDESAILDYDAARMNIAHESRAVADVNLVGAFHVSLQRTKDVNLLGLDAGTDFPVGRDGEKMAGHIDGSLHLTLDDEGFVAVNLACDCDVLAENGLGR